jgi:hypothetical protein
VILAFFLAHWFHFFYVPTGEPWYHGNVWGNAMVILVLAPLGWLWSKTKFWPIRPVTKGIEHLHAKLDAHHKELHARLDAHEEMHRAHAEKLDRLLAAQSPESPSVHTELPVEEGHDATP